jgi:hypothetical protein
MRSFARLAAVAAVLAFGVSSAQDAPQPPKPGPEHEHFKSVEGEWDAVVKFAGQEMKGVATFKVKMKFHLHQDFKSDFAGAPFEGLGTYSYCPVRKTYLCSWTDNMQPSPMIGTGEIKDGAFVEMTEGVGMDGKMEKSKSVWKRPDNDNMTVTTYKLEGDKETEQMVITYKRKK